MKEFLITHHAPIAKRHGEIIGSRLDLGLDSYGIEVANRQAKHFKRVLGSIALDGAVSTIITSPLRRAVQSSEIIADVCGILSIEEDERLKAQNFGVLEGMTFEEIMRDDVLKLNLWNHVDPDDRDDSQVPGGESNIAVVRRVESFTDDLLAEGRSDVPLVVTHGTVIDALIASRTQVRMDQVEGRNRALEGRLTRVSRTSLVPIGKDGENFTYIPGVAAAIAADDYRGVRELVEAYARRESTTEIERVHVLKLLTFLPDAAT